MNYLLLLFCTCLFYTVDPLWAQDSTRATVQPPRQTHDRGSQFTINNSEYLTQHFNYSADFNSNNPEMGRDVDENEFYLDPEFRPYSISVVGGLTDTLLGRIQLIDQIVEVKVDGRLLVVDADLLHSLTTEEGTRFRALRHSLIPGKPAPLLEVLFESNARSLYAYRRVEWQEPSQQRQRSSYDYDNFKKRLYRIDMVYLISPSTRSQEVKKMRDLIALLPEAIQEEAKRYARSERLRNREEDYVQLLNNFDFEE